MKARWRVVVMAGLVVFGAAAAAANTIIQLDYPDQSGPPGSTLQYFGVITNTGDSTIYLNSDSLDLTAQSYDFTINDLFFSNVPISLAGGASTGDIDLFALTVSTPFVQTFVAYNGSYALLGGLDGNAQNLLGAINFSVTPTNSSPEPFTSLLCLAGLGAIAGWLWSPRRDDGRFKQQKPLRNV